MPAPEQTRFMLVVVAGFAKFPFFHDARLGSFPFNRACLTEGITAFFRRPFPHGLALSCFPACASVSFRLRGTCVMPVHAFPVLASREVWVLILPQGCKGDNPDQHPFGPRDYGQRGNVMP